MKITGSPLGWPALLLLGVLAGSCPTARAADDVQPDLRTLMQQAAEAFAEHDHAAWVRAVEKLHARRPYNQDFMRQLVIGYALTEQPTRAFGMMLKMQQQGLSEDWDSVEALEPLRQYQVYTHLSELMENAGKPFGRAATAWTIAPEHAMPEAVAHDPETGRIFVGTVRDGKILVRAPGADAAEPFASPDTVDGLKAVFALHADARRGHLWVATGGTSQYRDYRIRDYGRTALIKLDLETGAQLGQYPVLPDGAPHLLGALDLADDGSVYAADTLSPLIYRLAPGAERPEILTGNPVFTGLRGLTLSADEQRLYVSDYELGVFFVELGDEIGGYRIGSPANLNLGGIDGLYQWRDSLVAIQNGISPERVLRLDLDETGTRVRSVATIAVAQPEFDTPTFGTVTGDDLLYLAGSHWQHVDSGGQPVDPPLPEIALLRSPIDAAENIVPGQEMADEILRKADRQRQSESDGQP